MKNAALNWDIEERRRLLRIIIEVRSFNDLTLLVKEMQQLKGALFSSFGARGKMRLKN
jgi:hypothetical protein